MAKPKIPSAVRAHTALHGAKRRAFLGIAIGVLGVLSAAGCSLPHGMGGNHFEVTDVDQAVKLISEQLARSFVFDEPPATGATEPVKVGVLGFTSPNGSTALGDRLAYELSVALANEIRRRDRPGVQVVTRFHLPELLKEQSLALGDSFAPGYIPRVGQLLGADFLLTGMLTPEAETVSVTAQLLRVADGVVAGGASCRLERKPGYLDPSPSPRVGKLVSEDVTGPKLRRGLTPPLNEPTAPPSSRDSGHDRHGSNTTARHARAPSPRAADDSHHEHPDTGGPLLMAHLSRESLLIGEDDNSVSLLVSVGDKLPHFEPRSIPAGHAGEHPAGSRRGLSDLMSAQRQPVHVCLVIDTSGSMESNRRLELAIAAAEEVLELLSQDDIVSLVSFKGTARIEVQPTEATDLNKRVVRVQLSLLRALGNTNFEQALEQASRCFESAPRRDTVNYMVFLSDGEPTKGTKDPVALGDLAHEIAEMSVTIDTVGVGTAISLETMDAIARHGNGGFHAVSDHEDLVGLVSRRVQSALAYLGNNAVLGLRPADGVAIIYLGEGWRLNPDGTLSADLGLVHPGESQTRILELRLVELPTIGPSAVLGELTLQYRDRAEELRTERVVLDVGITSDHERFERDRNVSVVHEAAFQEARRVLKKAYDLTVDEDAREASMVLTRLVIYLDSVLGAPEGSSDELSLLVELAEQVRAFSEELWEGEVTAELRKNLFAAATSTSTATTLHD